MEPSIERAIAERSASQLGLFTHAQARAAGLSSKVVRRRVACGALHVVGHRVLWPANLDRSPERVVMACCLDAGGVASHRTAAWLHGLDGFGPPMPVDVSVRKARTRTSTELGRVHSTTELGPADVLAVGAIPTTSVARTLLDLSKLVLHGEVCRNRLVGALETAIREGKASDRWLWWLLEERRCRGRDGVSVMETVLVERARLGPTESWLERETLRILAKAGLPQPAVQRRFTLRGAFVSRVDFAYLDRPVAIEVEGKGHLTLEQQAVDARQRNLLQLMGIKILTFTYSDVVRDPDLLIRTVRDARALTDAA